VQEEIRRQAIAHHKNGKKNVEIAILLEVNRTTVSGWVNKYKLGGCDALVSKKQGRPTGAGLQLSEMEQKDISKRIIEKDPQQLKLEFALWADEAGIKSHDHRGRGYAPKGKTPVRLHNPNGEKINKISSITNQGKLRFLCYKGSFTYRVFHRFLKGLIEDANGKKIIVILDNLRVHHLKVISVCQKSVVFCKNRNENTFKN
jgi:transposase